jgi:hypothetical protein
MKAKLIKTQEGYILEDTNKNPIGQTFGKFQGKKLSIKNCEAIANGYDLDEEVSNIVKTIVPDDRGTDIWYVTSMAVGKLCFQKALELNNTKHYTLEDMMNCWNKALTFQNHKELFGYHIQSLRQNKWDVEIVEECLDKNCDGINRKGECITTGKPKHDTDGCLTLKRVK